MSAARSLIAFALSLLLFSQETTAQGNGAVRLYNNGNTDLSNTVGIVEVYYNGRWGTICVPSSIYFEHIPDVVCQQLGYTGGSLDSSNVGTSPNNGALQGVSCFENNLVILQCTHQATSSSCASLGQHQAQVACDSSRIWDVPFTGMVRLQDGRYTGQGTVQVYCGGSWGAICYDSTFNSNAANTICTQLGYTSALSNSSVSNYNGRIVYENLYCPNVDNCLSDCVSCPVTDATCSANTAVYLTCTHSGSEYGGSLRYLCGYGISGLSYGEIIGIVIASLVFFIICLVAIIAIPICICCCLGIGIGAAARSTRRTTTTYTVMS